MAKKKAIPKKAKTGATHTHQIYRLNRIEGQVRGISKMIEDQRYCIDILVQLKAVKAAIRSVEGSILERHLNHCVQKALSSKNKTESREIIAEIKDLLQKSGI